MILPKFFILFPPGVGGGGGGVGGGGGGLRGYFKSKGAEFKHKV